MGHHRRPPILNLAMAEDLEDTSGQDTDRMIDNCSFRREQFDIFKHDFREAFDEHGHATLANMVLPIEIKKDVVNMIRRLQKAKHTLATISDKTAIFQLEPKISEVLVELENSASGNTEFSSRNVDLPEYDEQAMELLFGPPIEPDPELFSKLSLDPVKTVCNFNQVFEERIKEVLGAAQILLNDYNEFMSFLKKQAVK